MLVYRRVYYINVFSFLGFCSDSILTIRRWRGKSLCRKNRGWWICRRDRYSPPQLNMEPKNAGLVQRFFLFKWVIFGFHMLVLPEVYRDPLFPELFLFPGFSLNATSCGESTPSKSPLCPTGKWRGPRESKILSIYSRASQRTCPPQHLCWPKRRQRVSRVQGVCFLGGVDEGVSLQGFIFGERGWSSWLFSSGNILGGMEERRGIFFNSIEASLFNCYLVWVLCIHVNPTLVDVRDLLLAFTEWHYEFQGFWAGVIRDICTISTGAEKCQISKASECPQK